MEPSRTPAALRRTLQSGVTIPTCSGRSVIYINPNLKDPYSMTWTLRDSVSVAQEYAGGINLRRFGERRQYRNSERERSADQLRRAIPRALGRRSATGRFTGPYVNFGTISYQTNVSHSSYHSGTVHVQKRLANGLLYDSFFTYSKSLDDSGVGFSRSDLLRLYKGLQL